MSICVHNSLDEVLNQVVNEVVNDPCEQIQGQIQGQIQESCCIYPPYGDEVSLEQSIILLCIYSIPVGVIGVYMYAVQTI